MAVSFPPLQQPQQQQQRTPLADMHNRLNARSNPAKYSASFRHSANNNNNSAFGFNDSPSSLDQNRMNNDNSTPTFLGSNLRSPYFPGKKKN